MKRRPEVRFDPMSCFERFMELEAFRTAAILARARAEADAWLASDAVDEARYLFAEDPTFRN
jgi:hypothetical protein